MNKIEKALAKLTQKERRYVRVILDQLSRKDTTHLDIKKLKGRNDVFRIRKGHISIIYRKDQRGAKENIFILAIERRNEHTY